MDEDPKLETEEERAKFAADAWAAAPDVLLGVCPECGAEVGGKAGRLAKCAACEWGAVD